MNNLNCGVNSCANNCSGLCCLSAIKVDGTSAHASSQTDCKSFRSRQNGMSNSVNSQNATPATNISCDACNCRHNSNCKCTAEHVCVENCGCGTECETFAE